MAKIKKTHNEKFRERFCGVPKHILIRALNELCVGVNWTGCSKSLLAEAWEASRINPSAWSAELGKLTLKKLTKHVNVVRKKYYDSKTL